MTDLERDTLDAKRYRALRSELHMENCIAGGRKIVINMILIVPEPLKDELYTDLIDRTFDSEFIKK